MDLVLWCQWICMASQSIFVFVDTTFLSVSLILLLQGPSFTSTHSAVIDFVVRQSVDDLPHLPGLDATLLTLLRDLSFPLCSRQTNLGRLDQTCIYLQILGQPRNLSAITECCLRSLSKLPSLVWFFHFFHHFSPTHESLRSPVRCVWRSHHSWSEPPHAVWVQQWPFSSKWSPGRSVRVSTIFPRVLDPRLLLGLKRVLSCLPWES